MQTRWNGVLTRAVLAPVLLVASSTGLLLAQGADTPPPKGSKATTSATASKSDRDLTAQIRKAIVDDKSLSTAAHNITIRVKNGKVTLRGRVDSDAEKSTLLAKAKEIAGDANVTDMLTVAPPKTKKTTGE